MPPLMTWTVASPLGGATPIIPMMRTGMACLVVCDLRAGRCYPDLECNARFLPGLAQAGVDPLERRRAGAEVGRVERIERGLDRIEMVVQVLGRRIDIEQAGDDLARRQAFLHALHRGNLVVRVVLLAELAQAQPRAVVLLHGGERARIV